MPSVHTSAISTLLFQSLRLLKKVVIPYLYDRPSWTRPCKYPHRSRHGAPIQALNNQDVSHGNIHPFHENTHSLLATDEVG